MVLGMFQVTFAIAAWRKGWRWRVLIPIILGLVPEFGLDVLLSLRGLGNSEIVGAAGFLVNVLALAALAIMVIKPSPSAEGVDAPPSVLAEELSREDHHA